MMISTSCFVDQLAVEQGPWAIVTARATQVWSVHQRCAAKPLLYIYMAAAAAAAACKLQSPNKQTPACCLSSLSQLAQACLGPVPNACDAVPALTAECCSLSSVLPAGPQT